MKKQPYKQILGKLKKNIIKIIGNIKIEKNIKIVYQLSIVDLKNRKWETYGIFENYDESEKIAKEWNSGKKVNPMCIMPLILNKEVVDEESILQEKNLYYPNIYQKPENFDNLDYLLKFYK